MKTKENNFLSDSNFNLLINKCKSMNGNDLSDVGIDCEYRHYSIVFGGLQDDDYKLNVECAYNDILKREFELSQSQLETLKFKVLEQVENIKYEIQEEERHSYTNEEYDYSEDLSEHLRSTFSL